MRYWAYLSLIILLIPFLYGIENAYAADWYNSSWLKARKITIDQTDIDSDLTNYPLYVNLTSVDIGTDAQADCDDFVFTESTNVTKLDHEIETCDGTANWAEFWVEVPTVTGASDTVIYMYYDNAGVGDQENGQGTWNTDYQAVWHLNGTFVDSTSSPITCTNSGTSAVTDEYIGDSKDWDGVDDVFDCGSAAKIDNIWDTGGSISFWTNPDDVGEGTSGLILDKSLIGSALGWRSATIDQSGSDMDFVLIVEGATDGRWETTAREIQANTWNFVTVTYDKDSAANNPLFYIDGVAFSVGSGITEVTSPVTISSDATEDLCVGNQKSTATTCATTVTSDGTMDDFRFNNAILSAEWIKADWECQRGAVDGNSCITVGAQGTEPAAGDTVTVSDELAIEDQGATGEAPGEKIVSDELAIEDGGASIVLDAVVSVSDELAIEDQGATGETPGIVTVSDELAIEDQGASGQSSEVTVSDELAIEDVTSSQVTTPARNAIAIYVNKSPFTFGLYSNATRMACSASIEGGVIYNTDTLNLNICDGTNWILPDGSLT